MRILVIFILLAFGLQSQQTTVNGQQTLCTVPEPVEGTTLGASTSSATAYSRTVDCCPLSVDFYESQIRKADSLYKNYLPQSNFEEVKAAMEFFDSLRLSKTTDNGQRTTDFFHWWTTDNFHRSKTKSCTSDAYPRTVDRCLLSVDFSCAKAHYYHAVGLTEKDDIVGACEHYLIALEIMEDDDLIKSLRDTKTQRRKGKGLCDYATLRLCDSNKEDYEKIRFVALIYTRLGRLFYNDNYCDIAMFKYKNALKYYNIINDTISESYTYKSIGNVYQLLGKADSSLYYYKKSLEINSGLINKCDIDKNIAQILYDKGDKDSAYIFIKNNLDKIENTNVRYSYYTTIGDMFYNDKNYDSAAYYLKKCIKSDNNYIKHMSASRLSSLYDSVGNHVKKACYDDIISKLSIINVNKAIETSKLQDVYDRYKERKNEKERLENKKKTNLIASAFIGILILTIIIIIQTWHKSKRKDIKYLESLNEKDKYIASKEEIISKTNEEIKRNESEITRLVEIIGNLKSDINSLKDEADMKEHEISGNETDIKKMENDLSAKERDLKRLQENVYENSVLIDRLNETHKTNEERIAAHLEEIEKLKTEINLAQIYINDLRFKSSLTEGKIKSKNAELKKKEELIKEYTTEISNLKYRLERKHIDVSNLNNYLQSDVCFKILNEIKGISEKKLKSNTLSPLSKEEFVLLLNSANYHLNHSINDLANKYPKLKKEDLYYLCLVIMGLDNGQIASLFGVTYDTAKKREKKICIILGLNSKEKLYNYLLQYI